MSFLERAKKKKFGTAEAEEKVYSSTTQSSTSSNSSTTGSTFLERARNKKTTESLGGWAKSSIRLLNEMHDKSKSWSYKDEHGSYSSKISDLLSQADKWRKQYSGNDEAISYINSIVSSLSDTKQSASKIQDFYSKYESEDEYNIYNMSVDDYAAQLDGINAATSDLDLIFDVNQTLVPIDGYGDNATPEEQKEYEDYRNKLYTLWEKYGKDKYDTVEDFYYGEFYSDAGQRVIQAAEEKSKGIAYTNKSGQNITWQSLYDNAYANQDLQQRLELYSGQSDWDELSKGKDISSDPDRQSDYDLVLELSISNIAYDKETALANGTSEAEWNDIDQKRRYISEKYGVDLYSDIYDNANIFNEIMSMLDDKSWESNELSAQLGEDIIGEQTFTNMRHLTPGEKAVLNYIFYTQGRDAALQWHNSRMNIYQDRANGVLTEEMYELGKESPFWGSVGSVALSLGSSVEYLTDIFDYWATGESQNNSLARASSGIRYGVSSTVDWEIGNWDAFDFVYNTTMSGVDSLAASLLPGNAGGVLLGLSAAAQATNDALDRGMSSGQAFWSGLTAGVFEGLFESWSIGKFKGLQEVASAHAKDIALNIAKSMLVNASEETLTEIANIAYDTISNGDFSQYETLVRQYVVSGMSESEAKKKASGDIALQIGESAASGALMGFGFGGIGSAGPIVNNTIGTAVRDYDTGKTIMGVDGGVDALKAFRDTNSKVSKQADKVTGETFSGNGIGKIGAAVKNATNQRNIGKLYRSVVASTVSAKDQASIAKGLEASGFSAKSAKNIADALAAKINGKQLTNFQKATLESVEGNKKVDEVVNNLYNDAESSVGKRSADLEKFNLGIALGVGIAPSGATKAGGESATAAKPIAESSYETSGEGKTILDGQEVKLNGLRKTEDGSVMVVTADNQTADPSEVTYPSEGHALVYENYVKIETTTKNPVIANMDVEDRSALAMAFDPASGVDAKVQFIGLNQAYWYGFEGISMDEKTLPNNSLVKSISQKQRDIAYELGRKAGEKAAKTQGKAIKAAYEKAVEKLGGKEAAAAVAEKKEGKVILENNIKESAMTEKQRASYELAKIVSKAISTNIHVYHGMKEYGKYDTNTGEIWLNINGNFKGSSMMAFTLAHELVHLAKQWKPDEFDAFARYLVKQYGEKGYSVERLVRAQMANAKENGYELDEHEAYEEVIADACMRMLLDGDALQKMAEYKAENPGKWQKIINAIKDFIARIRKVFNGAEPDAEEAAIYNELDAAVKENLEDRFVKMVMGAGEHMSTIRNAFGKGTVVEVDSNGDFTLAKGKVEGATKFLYNDYTWETGGRDTLSAALKAEGFSDADIKAALTIMDGKHNLVKELAKQFSEQDRINKVTVTTDLKDGHSVLSALVSNGDYPVNIDLLMVCKKRKAYQRVINRLCETGMIQQATVDALAIAEINKILGRYGFETACLGCFVESRRLRIQEWANTIVKEWNSEVKKRNPNAKAFGFGKGEATLTEDEVMQLVGELESGGEKNDQGNLNLGKGSAVKRMGVLLDKVPSLRKTLSVEDLITPDGLSSLRRYDSNLFSMVKSRYGSNSPKFVQEFNPYNHELAIYGKVPSEYKNLREYLYAIGGARMQSFSDFIVENWFDYCQIVADLAARKLPMHTYTKEIALAKLFGLTGIKINMSLIPDIDRSLGKEFAGLTRNEKGELELIWADKDRFKATGGKSYMQSINFADAIALQNDPRYSANVGTIAVGVSDNHILMMLDDNRIRMIIPYHSSGMNPIFADLMGTSYYKDYTLFQNTTVKQLYNSKGKPVSMKLEKEQTNKLTSGFQFNAVLQEMGDARAAAQAYKDWCADASKHTITIKGETYTAELTPKFDSFSWHDNYYKLLEDFNTYDCITEEAARQGDVQQTYPEDFDETLKAELKAQEKHRQKQEETQAFDNAMGEIEAYLSEHTKADTVFYAEQHGVKLSAKDKKLGAEDKKKLADLRKGMKMSMPKAHDNASDIIASLYNYDTVDFDKAVVDFNLEHFEEQWKKGYYGSVVDTIAKQTGKSKREVWSAFAGILMRSEGIAKVDGKTYINVHELNESNLRKAFELGGLAAPSIGIVDVDKPVTHFGDIALIFPDIFNPETTPTYYGDSYSSSFPAVGKFTDETMLTDALIDGFDGMEWGGILTNEEVADLLGDLKQVYFYDEEQRTSHAISKNGYASTKEFARSYNVKGIDGLQKLYEGLKDQYDSYEMFLEDFAEKAFTNQRMHRTYTGNSDLDWNDRVYQFNAYTLDNVVNEITAHGDDDFRMALGEKATGYDELTSDGMRARLKAGSENFYEVKPQRAVYIGEATYAVVPEKTSADVVEMLESEGVKVVKYQNKDGYNGVAEGRTEAIKGILETDTTGIRYKMPKKRTFTYNELVARGSITGEIIKSSDYVHMKGGLLDEDWMVKRVIRDCEKIQTGSDKPTYYAEVPDIGRNVQITSKGILHGGGNYKKNDKGVLPPAAVINNKITVNLVNILRTAIEVNHSTRGSNIDNPFTHIMLGVAGLENADGTIDYYGVRIEIEERVNRDPILVGANVLGRLKAVNAKKISSPHAQVTDNAGVALATGSFAYNIADLLKDVKKDFDDTFSVDVYRKLKMSRKKNDFSENLLYKTPNSRGMSSRQLLADAFDELVQTSKERELMDQYRNNISKVEDVQERLRKLRGEISKLTKSKGDKAKIAEMSKTAKDLAELVDKYDRKLLELEASKPLRDVLARAKSAAYQEARQRSEKDLDEYRQQVSDRFDRGVESRRKTEMRKKIRKVIRDLDKILNRGDKKRNVKEDMKDFVAEALSAAEVLFTDNYTNEDIIRNGFGVELSKEETKYLEEARKYMDELANLPVGGYDNWQARQEAEEKLKSKLAYRMSKLKDAFFRERQRLNKAEVAEVLGNLADAYAKLETSEYAYVNGAYHEAVYEYLKMLQEDVGGAKIKDMTLGQLNELYKAYTMVLTTVQNANKMFAEDLKQSKEELANRVMMEVYKAGGEHGLWSKGQIARNQASWNNTKPIYAAERTGSSTFVQLVKGLFKGQYNWATDMEEAKAFRQKIAAKYGFKNWDMEKTYKFTSSSGIEFELNLDQIMSLYAYAKREQAHDHLLKGGFVFGKNTEVVVTKNGIKRTYLNKSAKAHNISDEIMGEIIAKMDEVAPKARYFVDEMQEYLSTTMGDKGNDVSMRLYGVNLFMEKFYFPLRSAGQFKEKAKEAELKQQQGHISIANSGFTHGTKPKASNPVVLDGFTDVWANHVNEMSLYHSMVLPMEDFRRVYNYASPNMEGQEPVSVNSIIENAYGDAATGYFDQLYKELNGGAIVDPRENLSKQMIGKFKKASVMLSNSVVVQQFSAIGRAFALIDPKYFIGSKVDKKKHAALWEEMKQYAPVAIIKEMGGFDTHTGLSAKDYLLAEEYGKGEKVKGFIKDEQYRSDIMGMLPAKADELTWSAIWEAVKRETKAKNKGMDVKSEEFLKKAGERFSEVIEKTQVYDSVLARSANMRSKQGLMQMLTAFMAEPTTTVNMVEDALRKGNKKYIARTFGAVAASIILNNALASIVYAMRDDDEDETFLEKYFQALTSGMLDDINPMTYYPILKDIWSLFQGYDVERSDMAIYSDLSDSVKKLVMQIAKYDADMDEHDVAAYYKEIGDALMGILDAGASAFGIPWKNVRRDLMSYYNTYKTFAGGGSTTWNSFVDAVGGSALDSIPIVGLVAGKSTTDNLYEAIIKGDTAYVNRLKAGYKDDDAFHNAIRKSLRENDPRIKEAAIAGYNGDPSERVRIARLIIADGFVQDDVVVAINAEINAMKPDEAKSEPKKKGFYTAEDFAKEIANGDQATANVAKTDIIQTAQKNGKSEEEATDSFKSSAKSELKKLYISGGISDDKVVDALVSYCDMDETEAELQVESYDWEDQGYEEATSAAVRDYNTYCAAVSVPKDVYLYIRKFANKTENDKDANGKSISYSAMKKVMAEINAQSRLSSAQKTAIARSLGWSEKNIQKYKTW